MSDSVVMDCYDIRFQYETVKEMETYLWRPPIGVDAGLLNYDHYLLMIFWPPEMSSMVYDVITNFAGRHLIYVGENKMGRSCTANEQFHTYLNDNFKLVMILTASKYLVNNPYTYSDINIYIYERISYIDI